MWAIYLSIGCNSLPRDVDDPVVDANDLVRKRLVETSDLYPCNATHSLFEICFFNTF